ncbi:hypothetical protein TWF694_000134 [Orbilia ellipsospora]|uniref:Uncharacterized protein n=1 Tax=Orbilia ellipsospora TaxID=2528407 RepID=A0AAV9XP42_9PEZI
MNIEEITTSFVRGRKRPRGFIYQVYSAMKPYLGGYRGAPSYARVQMILLRSKNKSRHIEDLLNHRRQVDIIRQCLQLMEQHIFKNEEVAFNLYPQLDLDNPHYEDPGYDCSDEDYMIPPDKFEPGRRPYGSNLVEEKIQLPKDSKLLRDAKPLTFVPTIQPPTVTNENTPPEERDTHPTAVLREENPAPKYATILPEPTQACLFNRLEWIMQMTCFEFMCQHDFDLLYNERVHNADLASLRYWAILICHSEELPKDAILGGILDSTNPRPSLETLLYPLLKLNAQKHISDPIKLRHFYQYIDLCHSIAKSLRSPRIKKLDQFRDVVRLMFENFTTDLEKQRSTGAYVIKQTFAKARKDAQRERNGPRRAAKFAEINKHEREALAEADDRVQARYTFEKYTQILRFFNKEDEISSISGSTLIEATENASVRNIIGGINGLDITDRDIDDVADPN